MQRVTSNRDVRIIGRTIAYTFCGLVVLVGLGATSSSTIALGLSLAVVFALLFNEGHVRSRLPLLGSSSLALKIVGWVVVFFLYVAVSAAFQG